MAHNSFWFYAFAKKNPVHCKANFIVGCDFFSVFFPVTFVLLKVFFCSLQQSSSKEQRGGVKGKEQIF